MWYLDFLASAAEESESVVEPGEEGQDEWSEIAVADTLLACTMVAEVTEQMVIETNNYDTGLYGNNQLCMWLITAPQGMVRWRGYH